LARCVSLIWLAGVYAFLYIPIVVFFIFSFNHAPFPAPWAGFTLDWYGALLHETDIWMSVAHSLIVASSAVLVSGCMGIFLLFYVVNRRTKLAWLPALFYGNLIVPEIVFAVGFLALLTAFNIPLG